MKKTKPYDIGNPHVMEKNARIKAEFAKPRRAQGKLVSELLGTAKSDPDLILNTMVAFVRFIYASPKDGTHGLRMKFASRCLEIFFDYLASSYPHVPLEAMVDYIRRVPYKMLPHYCLFVGDLPHIDVAGITMRKQGGCLVDELMAMGLSDLPEKGKRFALEWILRGIYETSEKAMRRARKAHNKRKQKK